MPDGASLHPGFRRAGRGQPAGKRVIRPDRAGHHAARAGRLSGVRKGRGDAGHLSDGQERAGRQAERPGHGGGRLSDQALSDAGAGGQSGDRAAADEEGGDGLHVGLHEMRFPQASGFPGRNGHRMHAQGIRAAEGADPEPEHRPVQGEASGHGVGI